MQQEGIQEKEYVVEKLDKSQTQSKVKEKLFGTTKICLTQKAYEGTDAASFSTVSHELGHFFTNREKKIHPFFFFLTTYLTVLYLVFVAVFDVPMILHFVLKNSLGVYLIPQFIFDHIKGWGFYVMIIISFSFFVYIFSMYLRYKDENFADERGLIVLDNHLESFFRSNNQYSASTNSFLQNCKEDIQSNISFKWENPKTTFLLWFFLTLAFAAVFFFGIGKNII